MLTFYGFVDRDSGQLLAGWQVPQHGHLVSTGCQQAVSLGREAQGRDRAEVVLQCYSSITWRLQEIVIPSTHSSICRRDMGLLFRHRRIFC